MITVPTAIFANVHTGDLPLAPNEGNLFGGHILFTSGTTGRYKKVLQEGAIEEKRNIVRARQSFFGRDTIAHLGNFMLSTGGGFKNPSAVQHVGGCVVVDQRPNLFANYFKHKITHAFVVPSMLNALLHKYDRAQRFRINQIEFDVIGGFTPLKLAEQVVRDLNSKLSLRYSATETGGLIMCTQFKTKDDLYWYAPVNDRTIQIVDEFGHECPTGQEGNLRVGGMEIDSALILMTKKQARGIRHGFFLIRRHGRQELRLESAGPCRAVQIWRPTGQQNRRARRPKGPPAAGGVAEREQTARLGGGAVRVQAKGPESVKPQLGHSYAECRNAWFFSLIISFSPMFEARRRDMTE